MPRRKDPTTPLGELVRDERLSRKWTQAELALKAGIPRQAVTDLEVGPPTRKVHIERIVAVARAFEAPLLRFLAVAAPGEIEGQLNGVGELSMEEQGFIAEIRRLPQKERTRVLAYVRLAQELSRDEAQ